MRNRFSCAEVVQGIDSFDRSRGDVIGYFVSLEDDTQPIPSRTLPVYMPPAGTGLAATVEDLQREVSRLNADTEPWGFEKLELHVSQSYKSMEQDFVNRYTQGEFGPRASFGTVWANASREDARDFFSLGWVKAFNRIVSESGFKDLIESRNATAHPEADLEEIESMIDALWVTDSGDERLQRCRKYFRKLKSFQERMYNL